MAFVARPVTAAATKGCSELPRSGEAVGSTEPLQLFPTCEPF